MACTSFFCGNSWKHVFGFSKKQTNRAFQQKTERKMMAKLGFLKCLKSQYWNGVSDRGINLFFFKKKKSTTKHNLHPSTAMCHKKLTETSVKREEWRLLFYIEAESKN